MILSMRAMLLPLLLLVDSLPPATRLRMVG
jgi:hypothetical protein